MIAEIIMEEIVIQNEIPYKDDGYDYVIIE